MAVLGVKRATGSSGHTTIPSPDQEDGGPHMRERLPEFQALSFDYVYARQRGLHGCTLAIVVVSHRQNIAASEDGGLGDFDELKQRGDIVPPQTDRSDVEFLNRKAEVGRPKSSGGGRRAWFTIKRIF